MTDKSNESRSVDEAELERLGRLLTEALTTGDQQEAASLCHQAMAVARRLGNCVEEATILTNLASFNFADGKVAEAIAILAEVIDRIQEADNPNDSDTKATESQIWFRFGLIAGECNYAVGVAKLIAMTHFLDPTVQKTASPEWVCKAYAIDRGRTVLRDVVENWPNIHS
jgi:hypothetical protein